MSRGLTSELTKEWTVTRELARGLTTELTKELNEELTKEYEVLRVNEGIFEVDVAGITELEPRLQRSFQEPYHVAS